MTLRDELLGASEFLSHNFAKGVTERILVSIVLKNKNTFNATIVPNVSEDSAVFFPVDNTLMLAQCLRPEHYFT